jgi:diaminohydroxyphosphoribosylaminopyrimidine deaminase/5-amino-6-(5-phosphoribosylamino)uracil reductase
MDGHDAHMARALELAERGWGRVSPNPMVGAVVLAADGRAVGEGWHEGLGTDHAEVMALADAREAAHGGTVVVTLEPCSHIGRTPPCTGALLAAGVARVLVATPDPNLETSGIDLLRGAGVAVEVGMRQEEARRLNAAFERHVRTGRPFVVLKTAASLDGKTAAADRSSRWITSEAARADAQRLRAWADAIVVGARTVREDDPSLTVRAPDLAAATPPLRVVVDATGGTPLTATVFDRSAPTLVATTDRAPDAILRGWQDAGADVVVLDQDRAGAVSLDALLAHLGKRDVQGVLVEGGSTLAGSFVREDLVDRLVLYVAPLLLGGAEAPGILSGEGFAPVGEGRRVSIVRIDRLGPDLRVEADVHRDR